MPPIPEEAEASKVQLHSSNSRLDSADHELQ